MIILPYPPSVNRNLRTVGGRPILSAPYRAWRTEAEAAIKAQGAQPIAGRYDLTIWATAPDKRRRDLDNLIKPISDALVRAGVVVDDSLMRALSIRWTEKIQPGGRVVLRVEQSA
ncbi:MAG: RusA family crossover junction endodeoxyribonuclease [Phenylobacterium sp.]|uniref:RusA family crossover junction endodeoxyribonuclease n=1 Tax=Phenylobacterium sp. TaxID=1871053 RepID=UPI0025D6B49F|nr:RusA family crossover junction endodeoxyribonuclease [Phenylobacterium sp.]MCA6304111.1 RusA family crossover junction endodeoxyribonuclease [Phenylobacterium sp.]